VADVPKVSQEYRDARRQQILDAAKRCFLREGFHETSMQDLFAESGLSAGAVYRYFRSKDDMILAIADANLGDVVALIHALATSPRQQGLGAAMTSVLTMILDKHEKDDLGTMAVIVWSEVLRNPLLAQRLDASLSQMRADFTEVVRGHQAQGTLPADAEPDALAGLLMAMIPGFILQLAIFGDHAAAGMPAAARAMWPA
jgi:TetR/AcrR family transcriptional regulator, transcriptional repressor of aconitase